MVNNKEVLKMIILYFLCGLFIGGIAVYFAFAKNTLGVLKVDNSDKDSGPYLFMEINRNRTGDIYSKKYIILRVDLKNYISQK